MNLIDKRFWTVWLALLMIMSATCIVESWCEDTLLLGVAYALSLFSTWLIKMEEQKTAFINLLVLVIYNAILSYNLIFNSRYGSGMTWWAYAIILNTIQSILLIVYYLIVKIRSRNLIWWSSCSIRIFGKYSNFTIFPIVYEDFFKYLHCFFIS